MMALVLASNSSICMHRITFEYYYIIPLHSVQCSNNKYTIYPVHIYTYEKHKRNSNDQRQIIIIHKMHNNYSHERWYPQFRRTLEHTNSEWHIWFHSQFANTSKLWKASPAIKLNDSDSKNQLNEGQLTLVKLMDGKSW